MYKEMKKYLVAGTTALVFGGCIAASSQAASLAWDPTTNNVEVGETFNVNIFVGGLQTTEDLAGFDIDALFDNSMLDFSGYTLYDGLGEIASGDAEDWSDGDDGYGTVNLTEVSYLFDLSSQQDAFMLATLSFTATDIGASTLSLGDVDLSDANGDPIAYWGNVPGTVEITASAPVPEPATMLMFGAGLIGLVGLRRSRKEQR